MGLLDQLNQRLSSSISKLEAAASRTGSQSGAVTRLAGGNTTLASAIVSGDSKELANAMKAETRARNAATKALEAETAEKRALLPQIRQQARLTAFQTRTEEQQARAYQAASRLPQAQPAGMPGPSLGGLGAMASRLAIPAAITAGIYGSSHIMSGLASDERIRSRTDLSSEQKARMIREDFPIIGGLLKSFRELNEAVSGTAERMRQTGLQLEANRTRMSAIYGARAGIHRQDIELSAGLGQASYTQAWRHEPLNVFEDVTQAGRIAGQEYGMRRGAAMNVTRGERAQAEARLRANLWINQRNADQQDMQRAQAAYENAQAHYQDQLRNPTNRASLHAAAARVSMAQFTVQGTNQNFQESDREARQALRAAIQAETDLRNQHVTAQEKELDIMNQRLERTLANAGRFGAMGPAERMQFGMMAQLVNTPEDLRNIPLEMQEMYGRGNPERLAQLRQQFGETTPEYLAEFDRGRFPGADRTMGENLAQRQQLQLNINNLIEFNEDEFARRIAAALSSDVRALFSSLRGAGDRALQELQAQRQLQNAGL